MKTVLHLDAEDIKQAILLSMKKNPILKGKKNLQVTLKVTSGSLSAVVEPEESSDQKSEEAT